MTSTNGAEAIRHALKRARNAALELRADPHDEKELHRFRVALRRLTVYLREYAELLGIPESIRRKFRGTLRKTGPTRDRQVERRWLAASPLARSGIRLKIPSLAPTLWPRFEKAAARLERALASADAGRQCLRKAALRAAWRRHRQLKRRLARLDSRPRGHALHKTRISIKRLRYILETLDDPPAGLPAPAALKRLQTTLGDIHDRDVMAGNLSELVQKGGSAAVAARAAARLKREKHTLLRRAKTQWIRLNPTRKEGPEP